MAAAASESFSGRLETEVTSIFIRDSRSMSITSTLLPVVAAACSAAGAGNMNPTAANTAAHRFRALVGFRPDTAGTLVLVPNELFIRSLHFRRFPSLGPG